MPAVAKKSRPAKAKTTPVKKQPLVLANRPAKFSPKNPPLGTPERHEKGILFVKHLPHGFFEKQLRAFFCQFGDVTRVHVARSKRTLRSKGYAFVEFRYREVAQIAQETMDNYLMFGKILKTVMLPANAKRIPRQYEKAFDKEGKETTTYKLWLKKAVARQNGKVTKTKAVERNNRALAKLKKAKEQFKTIGVNYDLDEVTPDFTPDQLRKPEHDPEEEAIKARRAKRNKAKNEESVDESLLEKLLPEAANSDAEEDSSDDDDDDLDASFLPLEPEDWDEPASGESDAEAEVSATDKKSALQFAAKAKVRLDKEKSKNKNKRAPEADSPVKTAPASKKAKGSQAKQVESSPEVASSKKKEAVKGKGKKVAGGVTKKAAVAVGKKAKIVKEASKPVKAAAKALLEDDSVKKVKGKDIKKKKNKK